MKRLSLTAVAAVLAIAGCSNQQPQEAAPSVAEEPTPSPTAASLPTIDPNSPEEKRYQAQSKREDAQLSARIEATKQAVPEANRRAIWDEVGKVEEEADAEARRQIPDPDDNNMHPDKVYERQHDLQEELEDKARAKLARRQGITGKQLQAIIDEGFEEKWPTDK